MKDEKIYTEAFPELTSLTNEIMKRIVECREEVYKQAMRQILGREVTIEDGRNVNLIRRDGCLDKELLEFRGVVYGAIVMEIRFDSSYTIRYSFDPSIKKL